MTILFFHTYNPDTVHKFLSEESYWAQGLPLEINQPPRVLKSPSNL